MGFQLPMQRQLQGELIDFELQCELKLNELAFHGESDGQCARIVMQHTHAVIARASLRKPCRPNNVKYRCTMIYANCMRMLASTGWQLMCINDRVFFRYL